MTRSTGIKGLICPASPPRRTMASRMAARSTTAGTPVKSCNNTRRDERGFPLGNLGGVPGGDQGHVVHGHGRSVHVPQNAFEQDANAEGKAIDIAESCVRKFFQTMKLQRSGAS